MDSKPHVTGRNDDLQAAVDAVSHEDALVIQKLVDRIQTVKEFDKWYGDGARVLECTYLLLGLPTLASAVRPHLKVAGRVGRRAKSPPVDDYPDLVERVRAEGLLPVAEPEHRATPAASDERHRLAVWMAAYRQVIVPYLSFLASLPARRLKPEGSGAAVAATERRSAAAWPARLLARWRRSRDAAQVGGGAAPSRLDLGCSRDRWVGRQASATEGPGRRSRSRAGSGYSRCLEGPAMASAVGADAQRAGQRGSAMITRAQITRRASRDGVSARTVERDYVLAHIVAAVADLGEVHR